MPKSTTVATLISGWLCLALSAYGQWEGMVFSHLGKEQGLSSNQVNQIIQDKKGYLWFGTADGLCRFDGRQVKVFRFEANDPFSISSGEILSLKQSSDGVIWVGTREGFLNSYVPEEGKFYRYKVPRDEKITHTSVWDMDFDGDSLLWIGLERGFAKFDRRTKSFTTWRPSAVNPSLANYWNDVLYTAKQDNKDPNTVWLCARQGLLRFQKKEQSFSLAFPDAMHPHFFAIQEIQFEGDSLLWMAAREGSIVRLSKKTGQWKRFESQHSTQISTAFLLPGPEGHFWTGFYDAGFASFSKADGSFSFLKDREFKFQPIPDGACYSGFFDTRGRIWLGTDNGVFWTDLSQQMFRHYRLEPKHSRFPELFFPEDLIETSDGSQYLVATRYGDGIYIIDKQSGKTLGNIFRIRGGRETPPGYRRYLDLLKDRAGLIWVASDRGLLQLDLAGKRLVYPPGMLDSVIYTATFHSLKQDKNGNIFSLTTLPRGMAFLSADRRVFKHFTFENAKDIGFPPMEACNELSLDSQGNPWLFSEPFLVKYNVAANRFQTFKNCGGPGCLNSYWLYSGEVDDADRVWVGYNSAGIDCFDPAQPEGEQVRNFRIADGLPGEKVLSISKDRDGHLWLATNNGLSRLDLRTLAFRNFSEKDGLVRDDLGFHWVEALEVLESGDIFIGGYGFFSILDPRKIPVKKTAPSIVLNELMVNEQEKRLPVSLEYAVGITLQPDENFFSLAFAALEFTKPEQLRYRYRLEGYDRDWRESREGRAVYTDVPPGNYLFRVQAISTGNTWGESERSLAIAVLPPFYATWWFRLLLATALGAAVFSLYKWRIERVREHAALKAAYERQLTDVELKALRAQMNPHFLFNSLNSIKNYIVQNEPKLAARYLTKFSQLMRLILNNSKNEAISLEEELKALELYLELESLRFRDKFDFEFDIEPGLPLDSIEIPPLVLQPFVENAIWHGLMHKEDKGKLWVRVFRSDGLLEVEVEDNGVGRRRAAELRSKTATKSKSMGMQITSDRLSLVKPAEGGRSSVSIKDLVDADGQAAGTLVHIKIPLKNESGT